MKNSKTVLFHFFLFVLLNANCQQSFKLATCKILNFGDQNSDRIEYLNTVIDIINPDILVIQEILSQGALDYFYSEVLDSTYSIGEFIDDPDSDNAGFFKSQKFLFIDNTPIHKALRDINEFKLLNVISLDTIRIYSVHLKAISGSTNENKRLQEVMLLREVTDALPQGSNFIVCGDFNIYKFTEPAFEALLYDNGINDGHFIDPIEMTGTWNNSIYAQYHTQSPRVRQFRGGATGGVDDRFDLILYSQGIADAGGMDYVANSTWAVGNDGFHYNDSINSPPNLSVSQALANALHYVYDHLPVISKFSFETVSSSQEIMLKKGWNGISSYLQPDDNALITLLQPINNTFIILQNDNGIYYPGGNIETIQNWNYKSGYAIKVNDQVTFEIEGQIPTDRNIQISVGWNMIPVLSDQPVDLETLFHPFLSNVQVVKEIDGYNIYWPEMSVNNLPRLLLGTAYNLKSKRGVLRLFFSFPLRLFRRLRQNIRRRYLRKNLSDARADL